MVKVKVFSYSGSYPSTMEEEVNRWIAEAERQGAKIIQIAASGDGYYHGLWILYKE